LLTSVKTATEITKILRESDLSLEKAEIKLKLADLVVALADTKMQLSDVQELLKAKDKKICELEEAFNIKDQLVRPKHYDAYYKTNENGEPNGTPYCLGCWENNHKICQLVRSAKSHGLRVCTSCGHEYSSRNVPPIE
jgi:hypothetical protein